ncbi:MAG: prealbumin-like fold domain-containing protein [Clostridiales bacterium]|nr:prealbumin-like fold domain-containing protein [Clostridiales bacterium]
MLAAEAGASAAASEAEVLTAATESETGDENLTNVTQDRSVTVSAQVLYGETLLTAETEVTYYAALFTGTGTEQTIVSDVKALTFAAGDTASGSITFDSLAAGTYYVAATDEAGNLLQTTKTLSAPITEVTLAEADTSKSAVLQYLYTAAWPEDAFSYPVKLSVTLNVLDRDGKALTGKEKFYANIYSDADKTTLVNTSPITFSMAGNSTKTKTYTLKATKPQQTFYIAETDSSGAAVVGGENGFAYVVSYDASDAVTIKCGDTEAAVTIQNKLNDSTIKIRVEDASTGKLLSGATLAVKDSSGNIYEVEAAGGKTFASGATELVWTNALTDGETYYLTEITAPTGYTPIPDVSFTVVRGCTTEVVLQNTQTVSTSYALTAAKEVYVGEYQVYAYSTSGTSGNYTFYAALFSDAARTKKVSDVMSMQVSGFTGSVTFSNLTQGGVYYLAETDEYGIVQSSTDALTIRYTNSGEVKMSQTTQSMVIQNVYASLPSGYRYTGTLTFTLNVTDSSGTAEAVTDTFYAGIFRSADYSDTPTVVQLNLQNASTVTVRRRILLSGENDTTYYIAEVDSAGNRITDDSDFSYTVTVDSPTVTITKGSNQTVTITNKAKTTKATLYITKRVYDGSSLLAVSETFYAGLFKDAELTELYADPIALNLENESEKTLKLTLNLGSASGVTVYIAEVDKDGNVIEDQSSFGYQIKIVNATAEFTQDNLEIQTVLLNSVYGTSSDDDWDDIMYSTSSDLFDDDSYYSMDDNGYISGDDDSVQTGDNTPLAAWLLLLCGAFAVFAWEFGRTKKTLE